MDAVKALLKLFFGLLLILVGVWGLYNWWSEFLILLKSSIPAFVALLGLIFILVGISDMKSD